MGRGEVLLNAWERQKKAATELFREILDTPNMLELDITYHAVANDPKFFEYRIKRCVVPNVEDRGDAGC